MKRLLLTILGVLMIGWLGAALWFRMQYHTLYFPFDTQSYPASIAGAGVTRVDLDGLDVLLHEPRGDRPVILYFVGNLGNPLRQGPVLREYVVNGYGLVAPSYRAEGVGEGQLVADALAVARAVDDLLAADVPPERLVIHGTSLGSGIATAVAVEVAAAGLILETPFTRLCDVPGRHVPLLPYCLLSGGNRLATIERIDRIEMPLLVQHGDMDRLVPFDMGQAVFEAARQPKQFIAYPGGDHNDLRLHGAGIDARAFADRVTAR
ncbi:alpha/beta hydrolase [Roseobacter sp. HKCCA0434]|uniref:alpha/beta hydrolase n=1 Tax=Roseobacter sp. HKCCA0434 TaxID=3079297 RepID=UPI002905E0D3|nr:alpha/beta hydrolase [Roseobacter sp. HKCCA0434]